MKKIILTLLCFFTLTTFALEVPGQDSTIYNNNINKTVNTDKIDDPLRWWSYMIISNKETKGDNDNENSIKWIVDIWEISDHGSAQLSVLNIIKSMINYFLWLTGLVALVYLLYHGFLMVTASGDDTQYKKWLKWIKYAIIAIVGLWTSFFIISLIFFLIDYITWK